MAVKEIIHIHIGQAGVRLADACWELYCLEHGITPDGIIACDDDNNPDLFFNATGAGKVVPRVVMVDLDSEPIDKIRKGPYRQLFHPSCLLGGNEDASSTFARGFLGVGKEMIDSTMDRVRLAAESCHCLQGFIVFRAFGGGTGSGFTALVLDKLVRDYGRKKSTIEYAIYPAPRLSSVIVEPYNAVLTSHACMDVEDVCFIFDNEALFDIMATCLDVPRPTYTNLNRLIAQVVSCTTASMRFESAADVELSAFRTNLIPYPRIHFPLVSFAPFLSAHRAYYETYDTRELLMSCFKPTNQMVKCNPTRGSYMSCCIFFRGDVNPNDINYAINTIKAQKQIKFVPWSPTGVKIGVNYRRPATIPGGDLAALQQACVVVSNSSAIRIALEGINEKFGLMYAKRAFVHHYVGAGMEEEEFKNAYFDVQALSRDYQEIEN